MGKPRCGGPDDRGHWQAPHFTHCPGDAEGESQSVNQFVTVGIRSDSDSDLGETPGGKFKGEGRRGLRGLRRMRRGVLERRGRWGGWAPNVKFYCSKAQG